MRSARARRHIGEVGTGFSAAITAMHDLLRLLEVVPVENQDFYRALSLPLTDFEDAVQAAAAFRIDAEYLVTRNERDFKGASIATATPTTTLSLF